MSKGLSERHRHLSNRPGLRKAPSKASTLFVAPIITTLPRESSPSIRASSVDTTELWIWSCLLLRTWCKQEHPSTS